MFPLYLSFNCYVFKNTFYIKLYLAAPSSLKSKLVVFVPQGEGEGEGPEEPPDPDCPLLLPGLLVAFPSIHCLAAPYWRRLQGEQDCWRREVLKKPFLRNQEVERSEVRSGSRHLS